MNPKLLQAMAVLLACWSAHAQVNSGSNGSDGAFNPTTNTVINMADHPDGIYQYTSVNIPTNVTVTFIPNANNTPVVWLVQSNCIVNGTLLLNGSDGTNAVGGAGGPGGGSGGNGGATARDGQGIGGGRGSAGGKFGEQYGGNGSFATNGARLSGYSAVCAYDDQPSQGESGQPYGNIFLIPLLGGSGGGGSSRGYGGGGGGGAIMIAANNFVELNGQILCRGGSSMQVGFRRFGGGGSGGGVRIISHEIRGSGVISVSGGSVNHNCGFQYDYLSYASPGIIRLDAYVNNFSGATEGFVTRGFQPIIFPSGGQGAQLTVTSVGGVPVSASPSGQLATPDAVLSAQQNNPIPIVVHCSNIPLDTQITVSVKPANAPAVSATGRNSSGTFASSTATILINIPRGGGWIYATAATGN
jgi:hypothetical protein